MCTLIVGLTITYLLNFNICRVKVPLFIRNRRENKHPNSREEYHSSAQGLYFCSDITTDCSDYETGKLSEVVNRICTARYTFRSATSDSTEQSRVLQPAQRQVCYVRVCGKTCQTQTRHVDSDRDEPCKRTMILPSM